MCEISAEPTGWFVLNVESEVESFEAVFVADPALVLPGLLSADGLAPVQGGLAAHLEVVAPPGEAGRGLAVPVTEHRGHQLSLPHCQPGGGERNLLRGI